MLLTLALAFNACGNGTSSIIEENNTTSQNKKYDFSKYFFPAHST